MAKALRFHVVPAKSGWQVKASSGRHSGVYKTQKAAEAAAKTIARRRGGGEVFIHGRDGRIRDADTVGKGKETRVIKDPPHGGQLTKEQIRDAVWNGSKALRAGK